MYRVPVEFVLLFLTEEQKANHITVSQELFDRSNDTKAFWERSQQVMKRECTGTISELRLNRRSGWENRRRYKKSTSESIKCEGVVGLFLFREEPYSLWVRSTS
jgi:hypothetical protein